MITFSKLGVMGNLGNQLFQIATIHGLSKKYGCDYVLPPWKYSEYFKGHFPEALPPIHHEVKEWQFHFTPEHWDNYATAFKTSNVNITGWLQSEKYFKDCEHEIRSMFAFKENLISKVGLRFFDQRVFAKETIAISIRRGDYVDNPYYELLPIKYYLLALIEEFPDFRENYNILVFSDDFDYCRLHFGCLPNVFFAEGLNAIEQLCLGSLCDNFIIANSTFSWWMAWLGEKPASKVIRPNFLFAGQGLKENQDKDFWPERWKLLDHKIKKLDLKNVTFTIPVKYDSSDRLKNCELSVKLLRNDFDTNIIIGENGHSRFTYFKDICRLVEFREMEHFHRTKMLNEMAGMCRTPIVVNWDCDMVIPPLQLIEAAHKIVTRSADVVYPYDGRFARVNRNEWYRTINEKSDVGMFGATEFQGMRAHDAKSVGGAVMFSVQSFIAGGMENENFISYGPEDVERYDRFTMLGYRVTRIPGTIYHFDHLVGMDSSSHHPHFIHNRNELEKIRSLDAFALRKYVDSWEWRKKYMPSYYEEILDEGVRSRDIVFNELSNKELIFHGCRVVDAGCGLGNWGYKSAERGIEYVGIDFGVPTDKLVIPQEQYIDHDLRKPIDFEIKRKVDIVLCMEVAEHLEPEHADQLVENLRRLGDKVLFSAAIPLQGGVNHLNEQWQSYWAEKFEKVGLYPMMFDIRKKFWNNKDVGVWYRQNMVLYTTEKHPVMYYLDVVHPEMFTNLMKHYRII